MVQSLAIEGRQRWGWPLAPARLHIGPIMPIRDYLQDHSAFGPEAIEAMSKALEETCRVLHINGQAQDREVIAARIIDLARRGVIDATALSERVIAVTKSLRSL